MTGETRKRKWGICFDPADKSASANYQHDYCNNSPISLIRMCFDLLIAGMGILCGKVRYSIIGTIVFLVLYLLPPSI